MDSTLTCRLTTFFQDEDYQAYIALMAGWCNKCQEEIWAYWINFREDWHSHLWQERFSSFPMDEIHILAAKRYVEKNPVRANLMAESSSWPGSNARANLAKQDDALVKVAPLLEMVGKWENFLAEVDGESVKAIRKHERTGRPLGTTEFVQQLELELDRILTPEKPGPKGPRN